MIEKLEILGVKIAATNLPQACQLIESWIQNHTKTYVCIAPVSTIVDCQSDQEYHDIINNSGMTTPDGMPLVWIGKLRGNHNIKRTYGPDLMEALCNISQLKGYRHYLYGGTGDTCILLKNKLKERFPALNIVGQYSPPFKTVHDQESSDIIKRINDSKPDILWVGLGSPKQDYWMYHHREHLNVPVMIGVGAAFDFVAGKKRQAPLWIRQIGLEWLFRLCHEPKRLWKRYLIGNSKFIYLVTKDFIRRKLLLQS